MLRLQHSEFLFSLSISEVCGRWIRFYSTINIGQVGQQLHQAYRLLGLEPSCSKERLKERYVGLIKRYHPDSGGDLTDSEKFRKVQEAYKLIVQNDYSETDQQELGEVQKFWDIRHTAPQHRQYLEYGGRGYGTPSQRQKQHQQHRVHEAQENVHDFTINKMKYQSDLSALTIAKKEEAEYARKWKTRGGMERLVEDLIVESMQKGEFDKLPGRGKPLKYSNYNPYVDSMTHKLNQILIDTGFSPEWIMMDKEIRQEIVEIRKTFREKLKKLDPDPGVWSRKEKLQYDHFVSVMCERVKTVNKQVDRFNLVVPRMEMQMFHMNFEKEIRKANVDAIRLQKEEKEDEKLRESLTEIEKPQLSESQSLLRSFVAFLNRFKI